MKEKLKPEFVDCLKKFIDDHSRILLNECDRRRILNEAVKELERMKNGAEFPNYRYAFVKKDSSAKDLSKCLVMSLRIEFCNFLIVAQSDDFTNN